VRRALLLLTILAAGAASAIVSAGPAQSAADLPSGVAVRVGDATISRTMVDHWVDISVRSTPPRRDRARDYRPPSFAGCVARKRKAQRKGTPRPTTARLRRGCRADRERLLGQALEFLISGKWAVAEAQERGIVFTARQLDRAYQEAKRASFEDEAEFRRFLRESGMTVTDARLQIGYLTRYERLRNIALAAVAPVTDAEVAAYYERHRDEFVVPEWRDIRIVRTKTRTAATAARRALERGQTWTTVARKYSIDAPSRDNGGLLIGVTRKSANKPLATAAFGAPKGELRGPIRADFGYFVFKVVKIKPRVQLTLAESAERIRYEREVFRRGAAAKAFDRDLRARWKPRTTCRAGFVVDLCAGAPDNAKGPAR
jgi:foldase protein PrsA